MKPASAAASIDTGRVARLGDQLVGWQHKAVPPRFWGATVAELVAAAPRLSELSTPLLTLSEPAVASNIATMSRWAAERGLEIAPHGKTTMAPALWARQLKAGGLGHHSGDPGAARGGPCLRREPGDARQRGDLAGRPAVDG